MNWLFIMESMGAGLMAGLASYAIVEPSFLWSSMEDFTPILFVSIVFSGVFVGLIFSFPLFLYERSLSKLLKRFIFAASTAAVFVALGVISYRLLIETYFKLNTMQGKADRLLWWISLGTCQCASFGMLGGGYKNWGRAIMGIVPTLVVVGSIIDVGLSTDLSLLSSFLLLGIVVGAGYGIVWDLLRESWLDEFPTKTLGFRYYLDSENFWLGSSRLCDITIAQGPEVSFKITETDGMHILETFGEPLIKINKNKVKYKILEDGDVLELGTKKLVYHTRIARSRDIIPELAG